MKYQLAVAIGIVVVLGGMWANAHFGQVVEVENTTLPIQEVKDPDCMDVVGDEDACKAAEDVLQRKAWEEELNALESNFASTMAVYEAEKAEYESKKTDLEKKLGTYWTDQSNIKAHIRQVFPEDSARAIAIAKCESGLKPAAYNPNNPDGTTDGGLWQINTVHDAELARLGLDKYNPEDATTFARILYERNGWRDWVCYWKGMHLTYL